MSYLGKESSRLSLFQSRNHRQECRDEERAVLDEHMTRTTEGMEHTNRSVSAVTWLQSRLEKCSLYTRQPRVHSCYSEKEKFGGGN